MSDGALPQCQLVPNSVQYGPRQLGHVAVFQATQVSSWEDLRLALGAAIQRAPLRRAALDKCCKGGHGCNHECVPC